MTYGELSRLTGIDPGTLSRYEHGKQEPSVTRGLLVARALGVSIEFLTGFPGETEQATPAPPGKEKAGAAR